MFLIHAQILNIVAIADIQVQVAILVIIQKGSTPPIRFNKVTQVFVSDGTDKTDPRIRCDILKIIIGGWRKSG